MSLTGCEDKKQDDGSIPVENTTQVLQQSKTDIRDNSAFKIEKKYTPTTKVSKTKTLPIQNFNGTFTLSNQAGKKYTATVHNQEMKLSDVTQSIVIIHIFATWCTPCIGEITYFNDLQGKYSNELFIASVLAYDTIETKHLTNFIDKYHINYYLSDGVQNDAFTTLLAATLSLPQNFSIPLSIMYVNGQYFTHYEGLVPIEMIEYDIEQAKKKLKGI
jgi:thiol-disulfide isomerase/thioredoxin